jgi:Ni/Co efflux regulator RcnB
MKRLLLSAATALTLVGPLSAPAAYADPYDRREVREDRREIRSDKRELRQDRREWRDDRRDARWDRARHNGYWYNNHWYYGAPPARYYGRPGFVLGYHPWARGDRLPAYYGSRYYVRDYRYYHLRPPPRGYRWVRDDRGDFLLAAIATGIIADVIINSR